MRLGRKRTHNPTAPGVAPAGYDPLIGLAPTWSAAPSVASVKYRQTLTDLPYIKDWRVLTLLRLGADER